MYYSTHRTNFDTQMNELENSLLELASRVEKAVSCAIYALKTRNHEQARRVIANDLPLDALRYEIESQALYLLALQQPVLSRDLRYIAAVMHIAGELERMGDYAKGIARISDNLVMPPTTGIMVYLEKMANHANQMLHTAMSAFTEKDFLVAKQVAAADGELDVLYSSVHQQLLTMMMTDSSLVPVGTTLLWVAHNLERMGDRVANICERIHFVQTGIMSDKPGLNQDAFSANSRN